MSCYTNNPYAKSCVRTYNSASQAVTATGTTLAVEGNTVVNSGVSIVLGTTGFVIERNGLYHLSADVTFVEPAGSSTADTSSSSSGSSSSSSGGTVTVALCKDGAALPCATAVQTVANSSTATIHVETDLVIPVCCMERPVISVTCAGAAGTVTHVCAGVTKLA